MNLTISVLTCVVAANTFFLAETRRESHSAQTIPELARQKPANPVVRGRLVDIWPATLEELTTSADLVLDATLTKLKSYFTSEILFKDVIKSPFDEVATRIASIVAAIKK
jgi:hypothetical protein